MDYRQKIVLLSVEESLKSADADKQADLLDLKAKLTEVISLLQGHSVELEVNTKNTTSDTIDDEFQKFQQEIQELEGDTSAQSKDADDIEESDAHNEFCAVLSSMEGDKCRAPYMREPGDKNLYNAIIFSTDLEEQTVDLQEVMVKVMFCNPICDQMKPCPFFLDGHCKFSDNKCRYSHGYSVKFSDLEEYILPNYSSVQRDSKCLAKYKDGLWYSAVVENCLDNQKYCIKYVNSGDINTLAAHEILPLEDLSISDDEDDSSSSYSCDDVYQAEVLNSSPNEIKYEAVPAISAIGSWEQHTKGIGSKLMAKMGYVWGQGLGKDSNGRIDPVEAIVLPKGKSLDKCVEIREMAGLKSVEERFSSEQKKEQQRSKNIEVNQNPESSVFAFLNKNLSRSSDSSSSKNKEFFHKRSVAEISDSNGAPSKSQARDLNFEMYSVGEAIKKTRKEICRLNQSVNRNAERNEAACCLLRQKMTTQSQLLRSLEAKERKISGQIERRRSDRALF
ncbi:hypothetical protein CDAR_200341 [Caerostris darwini]|uniref:Zinc finger CCCH-type with G patch domain-containing protein n=1 Tax=Caerostris darwini TaxID=1538125 RepID=A0AAV4RJ37_9ARAC|nr:hypothetical protein CDAR_200341 [Caerostris darwini]